MNKCSYSMAWIGLCKAECSDQFCEKHSTVNCCVCGAQATNECNHTGQFVCGSPLCDECEGFTDVSKPSGSWGFMNHTHRKRASQSKETSQ